MSPVTHHHPPGHHEPTPATARPAMAGHTGHDRHAGHGAHGEVFQRLFWWNLLLAIPVVVSSEMVQEWFGYELTFWGADAIAPVLGTVIFAFGGRPFLTGATYEIRERRPGMMLLIAVAISVAFAASWAATLGVGDLDFWWELAALIVVMLLGHWLEMRAIGQASGALDALAALLPDEAERVVAGEVEHVAVGALRPGDVVLVRPGARIPADGTIVEGGATLDESMITGESRPVHRGDGEPVVAGTVSTDSSLRVRVDAVGDDTALAGIQRLVADAAASQSRAQALADRAAAALFYVAMFAAVAAMIVWSALGEPAAGIVAVVTVLVIACPHALGLAIPLVIAISTSIAARAGILATDRLALERMRNIDVVLFDKTGTLTRGTHAVVDHIAMADDDADEVLRLAAAAEGDSEHPIARAIVTAGTASGPLPTATDFVALTGRGVQADVDGRTIRVGGPALLRQLGATEPDQVADTVNRWRQRGNAVIYIIEGDQVIGAITVADEVRPESRSAVEALHERGQARRADHRRRATGRGRDRHRPRHRRSVRRGAPRRQRRHRRRTPSTRAPGRDGRRRGERRPRSRPRRRRHRHRRRNRRGDRIGRCRPRLRRPTGRHRHHRPLHRQLPENGAKPHLGHRLQPRRHPDRGGVFAFAGITIPPALAAIAMSLSTIIVAANAQLLRRTDLRPAHL